MLHGCGRAALSAVLVAGPRPAASLPTSLAAWPGTSAEGWLAARLAATISSNESFAVPAFSDRRWQEIAEARRTIEPVVLRMSIERGDVDWEARVRAAHHRLARAPAYVPEESEYYSSA